MGETNNQYGARIIGTGSAFPQHEMSNEDFESFLDTNDEWIRTRTGMQKRRIANLEKGESTLSLAKEAASKALEMAGLSAKDLDLIIVGTVTPNTVMPSTANQLQRDLGASKAFGFDLSAACSGFLYGMSIADRYIVGGTVKTALVVGAETLSTITNWRDRSTAVLFGDGAGAVILQRTEGENRILSVRTYSDGQYSHLLNIPHGYSQIPVYSKTYRNDQHKIQMKGREVFKLAVRSMVDAATQALADRGLTAKDVDFFIFHQANIRIIEMCIKVLGVKPEQTWLNVEKYGNTSAATLPVCLDEAWKAKKVKEGDTILMATFGGGLTWGAGVVKL